jgi:hypothetical protein
LQIGLYSSTPSLHSLFFFSHHVSSSLFSPRQQQQPAGSSGSSPMAPSLLLLMASGCSRESSSPAPASSHGAGDSLRASRSPMTRLRSTTPLLHPLPSAPFLLPWRRSSSHTAAQGAPSLPWPPSSLSMVPRNFSSSSTFRCALSPWRACPFLLPWMRPSSSLFPWSSSAGSRVLLLLSQQQI